MANKENIQLIPGILGTRTEPAQLQVYSVTTAHVMRRRDCCLRQAALYDIPCRWEMDITFIRERIFILVIWLTCAGAHIMVERPWSVETFWESSLKGKRNCTTWSHQPTFPQLSKSNKSLALGQIQLVRDTVTFFLCLLLNLLKEASPLTVPQAEININSSSLFWVTGEPKNKDLWHCDMVQENHITVKTAVWAMTELMLGKMQERKASIKRILNILYNKQTKES